MRLEEAAHDRDLAKAAYEEAKKVLEALPKPEKQPNPKKGAVIVLFILGVLALLAGAAAGLGLYSLPVGYVYGIILLALALLFIACLCSFSGRKAAREKEAALAHERELKEQALQAAEKQLGDCQKETDECAQARRDSVRLLIRAVRMAICTSGEPVSVSWVRLDSMIPVFSSFCIMGIYFLSLFIAR